LLATLYSAGMRSTEHIPKFIAGGMLNDCHAGAGAAGFGSCFGAAALGGAAGGALGLAGPPALPGPGHGCFGRSEISTSGRPGRGMCVP
jgi:hypothetical protein